MKISLAQLLVRIKVTQSSVKRAKITDGKAYEAACDACVDLYNWLNERSIADVEKVRG